MYQSIGVIDAGVTLVIKNMLLLGEDQASKIENTNLYRRKIKAFQLDSLKSHNTRHQLNHYFYSLKSVTNTTIFLLFCQRNYSIYQGKGLFHFWFVREFWGLFALMKYINLFFGNYPQKSLLFLKKRLFNYIINENDVTNSPNEVPTNLKMPLWCMTTTFNAELLHILEQMIGIRILPSIFCWYGSKGMQRRTVKTQVLPTN